MNIGIIGAGRIAHRMAATCANMDGIAVTAAAARDFDKARAFCKEFEIARSYEMYQDLLHDDAVDLIYVATPHADHYINARDALLAQKPVLCEKPFTANARQAEALFLLAKEKNLLLTEALWTRYMPWRTQVERILAAGTIGSVTEISADVGYAISRQANVQNPASGGGALLAVGVYALNFAEMFAGAPVRSFATEAEIGETGVDLSETVSLLFESGVKASLSASVCSENERRGVIRGTQGRIETDNVVRGAAKRGDGVHVYDSAGRETAFFDAYPEITGLEYEVRACQRALSAGRTECAEAPHASTLSRLRLMDALRADWGVRYPFE